MNLQIWHPQNTPDPELMSCEQVAFPSSNGSSAGQALVCGDGCPKATQANSVVACGHMYLDGGEELAVGAARDNYLTFFAQTSTGVCPVLGHAADVTASASRHPCFGLGLAVLVQLCTGCPGHTARTHGCCCLCELG